MRKVALVWHGDREARDTARLEDHRLGKTAAALAAAGLKPEAAVYNDDFADEVFEQLAQVDAVLVWVNPIEQGRDRRALDAMLKRVADQGVLVSAHPDTILKMGTKEVLYRTREMDWGSDVRLYRSRDELRTGLLDSLKTGPRVLKQYRGHSGLGVWKITPFGDHVLVRHAQRGSTETETSLDAFLAGWDDGPTIDQAFQERIADGTIRCYLVKDKIAGFGHQEINALHPNHPDPGPRLYYPPIRPDFQSIRRKMEDQWLGEMMQTLDLDYADLPMLWDADFMFGPKDDTYVLCEINVSSVFPYPEEALEPLAQAMAAALG